MKNKCIVIGVSILFSREELEVETKSTVPDQTPPRREAVSGAASDLALHSLPLRINATAAVNLFHGHGKLILCNIAITRQNVIYNIDISR